MNVKCSLIKLGDKWSSVNTYKYAWDARAVLLICDSDFMIFIYAYFFNYLQRQY